MAPTYDQGPDHGLVDPAVRAAWRSLQLTHLPSAPADVADLGCGTGSLSVLLAGESFRVRDVDTAPKMVRSARRKAVNSGVTATFECADAGNPPFAPATCDVVLVRHVLWALRDPMEAVARWVSMLRPGGRIVLIEGTWHTGGGIAVAECERILTTYALSVSTFSLDDETLWGAHLRDERYLLVALA